MAPKYVELAKKIEEEKLQDVVIAEIDSSADKEVGEKYGVEGFPTLKLFINAKPVDYSGEREMQDMYNFIIKRMNNPVKFLENRDMLAEIEKSHLALLILAKSSFEKQEEEAKVSAYGYDNINFYAIVDEEKMREYTGKADTYCLVLFRDFDDGKMF